MILPPEQDGAPGAAVLVLALAVLGFALWRSATNLQGHVRAGAQVLVEALAKSAAAPAQQPHADALSAFRGMFPGLGEPVAVRVPGISPAVGRTLSELAVRGTTGATILAIARSDGAVLIPGASEVLRADDVLALAGTHEGVLAARELLHAEEVRPARPSTPLRSAQGERRVDSAPLTASGGRLRRAPLE